MKNILKLTVLSFFISISLQAVAQEVCHDFDDTMNIITINCTTKERIYTKAEKEALLRKEQKLATQKKLAQQEALKQERLKLEEIARKEQERQVREKAKLEGEARIAQERQERLARQEARKKEQARNKQLAQQNEKQKDVIGNIYVSGKFAASSQKIDIDYNWDDGSDRGTEHPKTEKTNFGTKLAIGYNILKNVRAEVEYGYYSKHTADGDIYNGYPINAFVGATYINTFMINAYYDLHNSSKFTPYISTGLGLAAIKTKSSNTITKDVSGSNFAWSLGAGIGYTITKNIVLDFGVKYNDFGNIKESVNNPPLVGSQKNAYSNMEALLGIRYTF